jgi:magnesium-transporting ATPase (P-type)
MKNKLLNSFYSEKIKILSNHSLIHTYIQVQYVLSDKTGTLTQNHMILQTFSIAAATYESKSSSGIGSGASSTSTSGSKEAVLSMVEEDLGIHKNSITISPLMKTSSRPPSLFNTSAALPLAGDSR